MSADETEALRRRSVALDDERACLHAAFAATGEPLDRGTGLSTIDGFAGQSDGPIRIGAEPGCGTTAKLYLPRHHGVAPPDTVPVVEDDPVARDLTVEVPGGLGYTALRVAKARAGRD